MSGDRFRRAREKEIEETLTAQADRIVGLEELVDMLLDSQSADPRVIPLMYNAWLHKAKALKEQG